MHYTNCTYVSMAGDRDPTRPEYVLSDMLRPLPDLDWNFDTTSKAAASDVHPAVSSVNNLHSNSPVRSSGGEFVGHKDGDGASHVLTSDDSFSSGNESSPGGFQKRHNMSPFHPRIDKKSLHVSRGRGHRLHHPLPSDIPLFPVGCSNLSDSSALVQPTYVCGRGRALPRGNANHDVAVRPAAFRGRGRGRGRGVRPHPWMSHGTEVCLPVGCQLTNSDVLHEPSYYNPSVGQQQLESCMNDAASEGNDRQRCDMQQTQSGGPFHTQFDAPSHVSSAADGGRWQSLSRQSYFPPRGLSASSRVSESNFDHSAAISSSAADACAADLERSALVLLEDSADNAVDSHTDAPLGTDVDFIQFEPPLRCVHHTV